MLATITQYLWCFFIYSFVGWCVEVVFAAFKNGYFVNRGFLNGPLCPIYGVGLVMVLLLLEPLKENLLYLYIGSVLVTSLIELVTGYLMERLFHQRWWDYSKMPLNIGGYICLLFSLIWGLACMAIVLWVHPLIFHFIEIIPHTLGLILLAAFSVFFVIDVCASMAKAFKLNKRLTQIDEVSAAIKQLSDGLGGSLSSGALAVKAADEKLRTNWGETKESLIQKRAELTERLQKEQKHFLKAFPHLRSLRSQGTLDEIKKKYADSKEKRKKKEPPTTSSKEG